MTKFVGDAVGVRSGRPKSSLSSKDLRKRMDKFLETGVHPELEGAQAAAAAGGGTVEPLPDPDPHRPHVFMDFTIDNVPVGRLVVELFEDVAPAGAGHLLNRCQPGSSASLLNAQVHRLLPHYGAFAGRSASARFPSGRGVPPCRRLQHSARGAVSVSRDGDDFAISLGRSLVMDDTHQVVGCVRLGLDILDLMDDVPRAPDDSPLLRIKVVKCGATDAQGAHEALDEALAKETPEAAAARLKQQSADTRSAVMEALQQGMSHKRTADEAGLGPGSSSAVAAAAAAGGPAGGGGTAPSGGGAGAAGAAAGGGAKPADRGGGSGAGTAAAKRSKLLDSLLDDLSGSGSGSDDSGSEGGD